MASNYQQARLNALQSIGTSATEFTEPTTGLEKAAGDFVSRVVQNITDKDLVATGSAQNISIEIEGNSVNILGNSYLKYLDQGVNGTMVNRGAPYSYTNKMPPREVFVEWIKTKNLKIRNTSKSDQSKNQMVEEAKVDSAAYLMARKHFEQGQEATGIITDEIPKLTADCMEEVTNILIQNFITGPIH